METRLEHHWSILLPLYRSNPWGFAGVLFFYMLFLLVVGIRMPFHNDVLCELYWNFGFTWNFEGTAEKCYTFEMSELNNGFVLQFPGLLKTSNVFHMVFVLIFLNFGIWISINVLTTSLDVPTHVYIIVYCVYKLPSRNGLPVLRFQISKFIYA